MTDKIDTGRRSVIGGSLATLVSVPAGAVDGVEGATPIDLGQILRLHKGIPSLPNALEKIVGLDQLRHDKADEMQDVDLFSALSSALSSRHVLLDAKDIEISDLKGDVFDILFDYSSQTDALYLEGYDHSSAEQVHDQYTRLVRQIKQIAQQESAAENSTLSSLMENVADVEDEKIFKGLKALASKNHELFKTILPYFGEKEGLNQKVQAWLEKEYPELSTEPESQEVTPEKVTLIPIKRKPMEPRQSFYVTFSNLSLFANPEEINSRVGKALNLSTDDIEKLVSRCQGNEILITPHSRVVENKMKAYAESPKLGR